MANQPKQPKTQASDALKRFLQFPVAPRRHFRRLVLAGLALLSVSMALHIYFFYRIESYDFLGSTQVQEVPAPSVNKAKLKSVLDRYAQKEAARAAAAVLVSPVADPAK